MPIHWYLNVKHHALATKISICGHIVVKHFKQAQNKMKKPYLHGRPLAGMLVKVMALS